MELNNFFFPSRQWTLSVYNHVCWRIHSRVYQLKHGTVGEVNIAMENGPFIDDFPSKTSIYKGFSIAMLNNHRVQGGTVVCVCIFFSMEWLILPRCCKKLFALCHTKSRSINVSMFQIWRPFPVSVLPRKLTMDGRLYGGSPNLSHTNTRFAINWTDTVSGICTCCLAVPEATDAPPVLVPT